MKNKILPVFVITLLISSISFGADPDKIIYTWGYGDLMRETLIAVKDILVPNNFVSAFKLAFLVGLLAALLISAGLTGKKADPFYIIKFWFITLFLYYAFMQIKIDTIAIDDRTNGSVYSVNNVPWAIGFPFAMFSNFEYKISEKFDNAFSLPNGISYSSSGLGLGLTLLNQATMHKIIDPYLYLSMNDYIVDCVIPDILEGVKDPNLLLNSKQLWQDLGGTNPARITKYYDSTNKNGVLKSCTDAYNDLNSALISYTSASGLGMKHLADSLGGVSSSVISANLGTASDFFTKYSTSGQAYLIQSIAMNSLGEAYINWAKINGMSGDKLAYGLAKAREQANNSMAISGAMGKQFIPVMKGVITIVLLAFTPIIALLLMTPFAGKVLFGYIMSLIWLGMWHLGDVILNFIVNVKASSFIKSVTGTTGDYTIQTAPIVLQSTVDYINLASSYYWLIPTMSLLVISGFSVYTMVSMAGASATGANTGSSVGSETATGSVSMGNVSMNNASANKRSWTKTTTAGMESNFSHYAGVKNGYASLNVNSIRNEGVIGVGNPINTGNINNFARTNAQNISSSLRNIKADPSSVVGSTAITKGGVMLQSGTKIRLDGGGFITAQSNNAYLKKGKDGSLMFTNGTFQIDKGGESHLLTFDKDGNIIKAEGITKEGVKYTQTQGRNGKQLMLEFGGFSIATDEEGNIRGVKLAQGSAVSQELGQSYTKLSQNLTSAVDKLSKGTAFKDLTTDEKRAVITSAWNSRYGRNDSKSNEQSFIKSTASETLASTAENFTKGGKKAFETGHQVSNDSMQKTLLGGGIQLTSSVPGKLLSALTGANAQAEISQVFVSKDSVYAQDSSGQWYEYKMTDEFRDAWRKNFTESYADKITNANTRSEDFATGNKSSNTKSSSTTGEKSQALEELKQVQEALSYGRNQFFNASGGIKEDLMPTLVQSYVKDLRESGDNRELDQILKEDLTPGGKNYDRFKNYVTSSIIGRGGSNLMNEVIEKTNDEEKIKGLNNDINIGKDNLQNKVQNQGDAIEEIQQTTENLVKDKEDKLKDRYLNKKQDVKNDVLINTAKDLPGKVPHDQEFKEDLIETNVRTAKADKSFLGVIGPHIEAEKLKKEIPENVVDKLLKDKEFQKQIDAVKNLSKIQFGDKSGYDKMVRDMYQGEHSKYRYATAYSLMKDGNLDKETREKAFEDVKEGFQKGYISSKDLQELNLSDKEIEKLKKTR